MSACQANSFSVYPLMSIGAIGNIEVLTFNL
jgi:hypothetical protein